MTNKHDYKGNLIDLINEIPDSEEEILKFLFYFTFEYVQKNNIGGKDNE